jgi:hypothetical protein
VYWINQSPAAARNDFIAAIAIVEVYGVAIVLWWYGKRWCMQRVRLRSRHAA